MNSIHKYFPAMGINIFWYKENKKKLDKSTSNLTELSNDVQICKKCALSSSRTNTVFGTGDNNAEIMIIGEAPGKDEDLKGEPFVGRAGKLLNEFLDSINLYRGNIFITNTVKCRPPENRNPETQEISACAHYLDMQIKIINPKVIILLGKIAANRMLNEDKSIADLRGKKFFLQNHSIPVIVFYHPAYILRSPLQKCQVWQDLKFLKEILSSYVN